jgi:hypothetical protein
MLVKKGVGTQFCTGSEILDDIDEGVLGDPELKENAVREEVIAPALRNKQTKQRRSSI